MRAVVLVGGEGTRLRPLTYTVPKQMLTVAEVPMIERVLGHLAAHGVTEVVLSLGYRPDPFLALFPDDRCGELTIRYAVEPEPLDTAGAIRFAADAIGVDDTFLAVNGDVLGDVDLRALVAYHRSTGAEGTLHLHRVADDPSAYGLVITAPGGRVERFVEKPPPGQAPGNTVNAGSYVLEPSVLDRIATDRRVSIEREVFPAMVADRSLFALATDDYWIDTGTPAKFLQAQLDLLSGRRGPPSPGARSRDGGLWTEGDPVIDGTVVGPALVGVAAYVQSGGLVDGSIVGAGARVHEGAVVRGSVLMAGAAVGAGATVDGSIVGGSAVIGPRASLRDLCVIGEGAEVEAGAALVGVCLPGSGVGGANGAGGPA